MDVGLGRTREASVRRGRVGEPSEVGGKRGQDPGLVQEVGGGREGDLEAGSQTCSLESVLKCRSRALLTWLGWGRCVTEASVFPVRPSLVLCSQQPLPLRNWVGMGRGPLVHTHCVWPRSAGHWLTSAS